MNKNYLRHTQTGRSMVEMLAVIMIIGVLTVGALTGFNQTMEKYNVGKMHTDIQSISTEVTNLFSWMRGYPDHKDPKIDFQGMLCANDVFPDGCDAAADAYNPFGGKYTVETDVDYGLLIIKADGLPEGACEDLVIREWSYVAETPKCTSGTFEIKFE